MWDYDTASRNDLIGFADVPLRGLIQSGRISASLAMWEEGRAKGEEKRLIDAGKVEGGIELVTEPSYVQFGDVVRRARVHRAPPRPTPTPDPRP